MINKQLILIIYCLLQLTLLPAQCPERQSLYTRLIYLRDSAASLPPSQKLKELLAYESRMKDCSYRLDSTHALLLQRIGAAYYAQGDFVSAIRFTQQSISAIHLSLHYASANYEYQLKNYSNLIIFYGALNDIRGQRLAIDSSIAIGRRLPIVYETYLVALVEKVKALFYAGDYSFSYSYAIMGEDASRKYYKYNRISYFMDFFSWKINTLINDKKYEAAGQLLLNVYKDTINLGAKDYLGTIYEQLAEVMMHKGNLSNALKYVRKALTYDLRAGNNLGCMETLNNLGYLFYFKHLGNYKKALQTYQQALKYATKNPSDQTQKWASLNILSSIAVLYSSEGFYDSAFHYFQLAFDQLTPGLNQINLSDSLIESFLNNGNAQYLTELVIDKAGVFLARYKNKRNPQDLTEAIKTYKLADHLLDKIKMNHFDLGSKLTWRKNSSRLYEQAIEACYEDNRTTDAFYFFEKSRSVLLGDQLKELDLAGKEEIMLAIQIKKNIAVKESALKSISMRDSTYSSLFAGILENKQKLFNLQQAIKIRNPLYYQHFIDPSFITLRDVQQEILKDHNALIEIYAGDSAVYSMVIKHGEINFARIDKKTFDSTANLFITYLSDASLLNKKFTDFIKISNDLYQLLFKGNPLPSGRIIISPDGRYFPFEALVIKHEGTHIEYLLNKNAVSYTYSGRYLLNQFNSASQTGSPDFLGIAPVDYPQPWQLASLTGCDHSLKRLQSYFRNTGILLSAGATKNNFMKDFTKYKIIQLYTHASDMAGLGEPVIYFADSVLYLSELIGGERPGTNLIVLSGCNTGAGTLHTGEGVFSFNRGFAALGIPASITNLWAADKASVIQLTELFYKYLNKDTPTDVALQQAKIEFLEAASGKNKLPYYWAGTILAGKSNTFEFKKPVAWKTILLLIACSALALFAFYIRTNQNQRDI